MFSIGLYYSIIISEVYMFQAFSHALNVSTLDLPLEVNSHTDKDVANSKIGDFVSGLVRIHRYDQIWIKRLHLI